MKKLIYLVIFVPIALFGQITTTGDGNWTVTTTWVGSVVPTNTDDVEIGNNHIITISTGDSVSIADLWMGNNSVINIEGILTMDSLHINNNATLNVTGKVYILGGASLANNTTLTVNNTGIVDIAGDVDTNNGSVIDVDGTMNIGGNLTGTATVQGTGNVSVAGTIGSGILDSGPLPIELTQFNVQHEDKRALITWQTATEEKNDYFTLERSGDGINYETVAIIKGAGYSYTPINYTYTDANPLIGISYYRLTQTDYDGVFETFNPVSINLLYDQDLEIYPNPAQSYVNIALGGEAGTAQLQIHSMSGALIKEITIDNNFSNINIDDLQPGLYTFVIKAGEFAVIKRIVKE